VEIRHLDSLSEIAAGTEIVYVPCHRSHIDYMLLAYVIYRHGLAPPHTAAGINLNIPIVGGILRRGGAFFIRRSMQGNALYAAVFRSYFRTILARGFPVKYFIEGTRSRTGRLLKPKLGLLTMTIEAFLANPQRPIVFVPVYFGYEKLLEGQTFLGELRGQRKKQETLGGFLRSLKALRERFGRVQVSFAEPIALGELLDRQRPDWREIEFEEAFRPQWLTRSAQVLGDRILMAINDAAAVNSVNLVSLVTLCMPKQAIVEIELKAQLEMYLTLLRQVPYGPRAGIGDKDADTMIRECEELGWLERRRHGLGDVLGMDERTAVLASYYRNNVVHMFVLPALLASAFNNRADLSLVQIGDLVAHLYPCLRNELYLRLTDAEIEAELSKLAAAMVELRLLERAPGRLSRRQPATAQLALCAQIVLPFFERYYLGVTVLLGQGSGALRGRELIARCSEAAERLSLIYELNSPDLFQANLFENFVSYLEDSQLLHEDSEGRLAFDETPLNDLAVALGFVLPAQLKRTLTNLAGLAVAAPSSLSAGA
jgi:glycerol-3-phosphate O-acyltransferase